MFVKSLLTSMIRNGHYVIARVALNPGTGEFEKGGVGHWVVFNGIDENNNVYISDPFGNRQYPLLTWDEFYEVFLNNILEFIPPGGRNTPIPY